MPQLSPSSASVASSPVASPAKTGAALTDGGGRFATVADKDMSGLTRKVVTSMLTFAKTVQQEAQTLSKKEIAKDLVAIESCMKLSYIK